MDEADTTLPRSVCVEEGRKRAEAEQQLLANRLRLLRQEEAKARTRVEGVGLKLSLGLCQKQ